MDQRPIKYKVFQGVGDYPKTNLFVMLIKCIQIQVEKNIGIEETSWDWALPSSDKLKLATYYYIGGLAYVESAYYAQL